MDVLRPPTVSRSRNTIDFATHVANSIVGFIGSTDYLTNSSMISSLSSIVLHFLRESEESGNIRMISNVVLITNFNTLASALANKFQQFNLADAMQAILDEFADRENADQEILDIDMADHYNNILSILFKVLVVGFNVAGYSKDIVKTMAKVKASKELITTMDEAKDFFTSEILNIPLNKEKLVIKRLSFAFKALSKSYMMERKDYLLNPSAIKNFDVNMKQAQELLEKVSVSNKGTTSPTLGTIKNSLSSLVSKSMDRILTLRDSLQSSIRQEPTGLLLLGPRGMGKTNFGQYLARRIATHFGWNKSSYTMRVGSGFFEAYADQEMGDYQDAFNVREPDRFIKDITAIMGTNHYNMEGASIDTKHQACLLKHITVTTNVEAEVKLSHYIIDEGVNAIYSRFIQVKVIDPLIKPNTDPRYGDLKHRKPDYTHLKLYRVHIDPIAKELGQQEEISIDDLLQLLIEEIKKREQTFKRELQIMYPAEFPDTPASSEENHMFIRLQGKLGSGKSTMADKVVDFFRTVYRMQTQHIKTEEELSFTYPEQTQVFILDDLNLIEFSSSYMAFLRKIRKHSVVIITSNDIYSPIAPGFFQKIANMVNYSTPSIYTLINEENLPQGMFRRLGIQGPVTDGEFYYQNSLVTNFTATFCDIDNITHNGVLYGPKDIYSMILQKFVEYKKLVNEILIISDVYRGDCVQFDIQVISPDIKQLSTDLQKSTIPRTAIGLSKTKLILSKDLILNTSGTVTPEDFVVRENLSITDIATTLVYKVVKLYPGVTVKITLKGATYVYINGVLYIPSAVSRTQLSHDKHFLHYTLDGATDKLLLSEVVDFFLTRSPLVLPNHAMLLPDIITYLEHNLEVSDDIITSKIAERAPQNVFLSMDLIKSIKMMLENHPILTIGAGLLLSMTTIYTLYKVFTKNEPDSPNSYDKNNVVTSGNKKSLNRLRKKMVRMRDNLDPAYSTNDFELYQKYTNVIETGDMSFLDTPNAKTFAQTMPHSIIQDMLRIKEARPLAVGVMDLILSDQPNLLRLTPSLSDMTVIDPLPNLLEKNYFQITAIKGKAHALMTHKNFGITVAHLFSTVGETAFIKDDIGEHSIICLSIDKKRDLATFQVQTKNYQCKSILHHIADHTELQHSNTHYYLRFGTNRIICPGRGKYNAYYKTYAQTGVDWSPTSDIVNFQSITTSDNTLVFNIGDCGLPLVAKNDQSIPKLCGIHIAFNATYKEGRFAAITNKVMGELFPNYDTPNMLEGLEHTPVSAQILTELKEPKIELEELEIIGSLNRPYSFYMKDKSIKLPDMGQNLTLQTDVDFAPVNIDTCTKYAKSTMPKRIDGQPDILMKQAIKFGGLTGKEPKNSIFKRAVKIVEEAWIKRYGMNKFISTKQALNHIDGLYDFSKPMVRDTSPGFSYKHKFGINNKEQIIVNRSSSCKVPIFDIRRESPPGKFCEDMMKYRWEKGILGIPVVAVAMDCKKVELLPLHKVKEGDIRLFNAMDVDYNLIQKKIFGYYQAVMVRERNQGFSQIGINPQIEFHRLNDHMNEIEGKRRATDFKRFDKSHIEKMIAALHKTMGNITTDPKLTEDQIKKLFKSMGISYVKRMHVAGDHVYITNKGHASGSGITAFLNNYAVEVATVYCMLRFIGEYKEDFVDIEQSELYSLFRMIVYGDDRDLKLAKFFDDYTYEMEKEYMLELNYTLTPADKVSDDDDGVSFISRNYIEDDGLVYGALKKSSINRHLYFVPSMDPRHIRAVFDVALQEAVPWGKEYYNTLKKDISKLLTVLPNGQLVGKELMLSDYQTARKSLRDHLRFSASFGFLTSPKTQQNQNNSKLSESHQLLLSLERQIVFSNETFIPNMAESSRQEPSFLGLAVSSVYEYLQKLGTTERPTDTYEQIKGYWYCTVFLSFEIDYPNIPAGKIYAGVGRATSKAQAKENAYHLLYGQLPNAPPKIPNDLVEYSSSSEEDNTCDCFDTPNMLETTDGDGQDTTIEPDGECYIGVEVTPPLVDGYGNKITKQETTQVHPVDLAIEAMKQNMSIKFGGHIIFDYKKKGNKHAVIAVTTLNNEIQVFSGLNRYKLRAYKELFSRLNKIKIDTPNMDATTMGAVSSLTPSTQSYNPQSSATTTNTSTANLPMGMAPQDVGPIATMPLPLEVTASTATPDSTFMTLNPLGPTNMLNVGGIDFDIKTLIYTQPMATDTQYVFTDDMAQGQILLQIPYDVNSDFLNPFIRAYAQMHNRFAGSLMYNFRLVGNATFSGEIMIGWQPRAIAGTTVPISTLQKYSWCSIGCNATQSSTFELKDARKQFFYREVQDTDIDTRPHLVIAAYITLVSPLKTGITVRMRINSWLSNGSMCEAFVFADPIATPVTQTLASCQERDVVLGDLFKNYKNLLIETDGTRRPPWIAQGLYPQIDDIIQDKRVEEMAVAGFCRKSFNASNYYGKCFSSTTEPTSLFRVYWYSTPRQLINWGTDATVLRSNLINGTAVTGTLLTTIETVDQLCNIGITDADQVDQPVELVQIWHIWTPLGPLSIYEFLTEGIYFDNSNYAFTASSGTTDPPFVEPFHISSIPFSATSVLLPLPAGWTQLNFFNNQATYTITEAVAAAGVITNYPATDIYEYFDQMALCKNIPPTRSLQFDLVDPISAKTVCTVRFRRDLRSFVVQTTSGAEGNYRLYPGNAEQLLVHNLTEVENGQSFTQTDVTGWLDRTSEATNLSRQVDIRQFKDKRCDTPNFWGAIAGIAGSTLGGIGQGVQQANNKKHEKDMLNLQHEQSMAFQGAQHGHNFAMQSGMFEHNKNMQMGQQMHNTQEAEHAFERKAALNMGVVNSRAANPNRTQQLHTAMGKTHDNDQSKLFQQMSHIGGVSQESYA